MASRLDDEKIEVKLHANGTYTASTGGIVVENEGYRLWHPNQHGNVIEVEPDLIRKARRDGTLSDM